MMMVMMVMVMVMVMMMIMMMMMMKMKHGWPGNSHVEEEDHLQTGSSIKGFSGQIPQILAVGRQETRKIMWIASGKLTQEIYI